MSDCVYPRTCSWSNDSVKPCTCAHALVTKYQKRICCPLLDRIDIHIEVPLVDYEKLSCDRVGESFESIRQRVQAARDIQNKRFSNGEAKDVICNADMRVREIGQFCKLHDGGHSLMRMATSCVHDSTQFFGAPIIVSWNWRARLRTWQGGKRSNLHIWRRWRNIGRS